MVHEDPAFTSDQLFKKWKTIEGKIKPLFYKKLKKIPKAEKIEENSQETSEESSQENSKEEATEQETVKDEL